MNEINIDNIVDFIETIKDDSDKLLELLYTDISIRPPFEVTQMFFNYKRDSSNQLKIVGDAKYQIYGICAVNKLEEVEKLKPELRSIILKEVEVFPENPHIFSLIINVENDGRHVSTLGGIMGLCDELGFVHRSPPGKLCMFTIPNEYVECYVKLDGTKDDEDNTVLKQTLSFLAVPFIAGLKFLHHKTVEIVDEPGGKRKRRLYAKTGKEKFRKVFKVLTINELVTKLRSGEKIHKTGWRNRFHSVRGYLRHYKSGKTIFIKEHNRGLKTEGEIVKNYEEKPIDTDIIIKHIYGGR